MEVVDAYGKPILDANGNVVTQPAQFIAPALIQQLYAASQDIPSNPNTGYLIGGGGQLNITARNMDLGATAGIVSQGPLENPALANYFMQGAAINLNLSGNLDMFSTTISSLNGGNVTVNVGGYANIGSTFFTADDSVARGIYTVEKSDVSVIAGGDIELNGSRIAAYDGGNITVESLTGNVDAGSGGIGAVTVEEILVDPVTRQILTFEPTIPGSGILATTFPPSLDPNFPPSLNTVGNITVETPQGNITANAGGIVQLPLNGINTGAGTVSLSAGSKDPVTGDTLYVGNIDVSDSGVIGSTVNLTATGNITGVVIARTHLGVTALQNINVVAISGGGAQLNAGDSLQGTVFAVGSISGSGATVGATLLSQSVATTGTLTSSQIGFAPGTVANATSSSLQNDETARQIASANQGEDDDSDLKKKGFSGNLPRLSKTTGRVTMILPNTP